MAKFIRRILGQKEPEDIDIDVEIERLAEPFRAGLRYIQNAAPHIRPYMEVLNGDVWVASLDREASQYGEMVSVYLRARGKYVTYQGIVKISTKKGQEEMRRNADRSQVFVQSNYSEDTVRLLEKLYKSEREKKGKKPWIYLGGTVDIQSRDILNSEDPYSIVAT